MATPLQIKMALAYYVSPDPSSLFSMAQWSSIAAKEARLWLAKQGLIDDDYQATDKLNAYVKRLCDIPLPVQVTTWAFLDDEGEAD